MESASSKKTGPLRRLTQGLAVAAVVGLTLTGCGGSAGSEAGTRQLLLGHGADPANPRSKAADFSRTSWQKSPTDSSRSRFRVRNSWEATRK